MVNPAAMMGPQPAFPGVHQHNTSANGFPGVKKEKMGRDDEQLLVRELKAAYVKERTPRRAIEKLDKVRRVLFTRRT